MPSATRPARGRHVAEPPGHGLRRALVRAAGGQVTGLDGRAVDFSQGAELRGTLGLIASNGLIHSRVVEAMARAAGEEWGFLPPRE